MDQRSEEGGGGRPHAAPELEPEAEQQPELEAVGFVEKTKAVVMPWVEKLSVLPCYWKVIWAVVLLCWVPIAYTVAAPVPGSMWLFLVAWTSIVLRCAGEEPLEAEGSGEAPPPPAASYEAAAALRDNPLAAAPRVASVGVPYDPSKPLSTRTGVRVTMSTFSFGEPARQPNSQQQFEQHDNPFAGR